MSPARALQLNATLTTARLTLEPLTGAHAEALFPDDIIRGVAHDDQELVRRAT